VRVGVAVLSQLFSAFLDSPQRRDASAEPPDDPGALRRERSLGCVRHPASLRDRVACDIAPLG